MHHKAGGTDTGSMAAAWRRFVRVRLRRWGGDNPGRDLQQRVPSLGGALVPHRNFDQLDWRLLSEDRWQAIAALGYRLPVALRPRPAAAESHRSVTTPLEKPAGPFAERMPDGTFAIVSIATRSHLAFARSLFESARAIHPEAECYLCVADARPDALPAIPGVRVLAPETLDLPELPFLALKFTASELCCALKPHVLRHLSESRPGRYVYIDSDVRLYDRVDALLNGLIDSDFVVTPHMTAPFPNSWNGRVKPTQGDLLYAGLLNAGMFAFQAGPASRAFLDTWATLVTQPGAFMAEFGGQCEQHAFNWVLTFVDRIHILRDPATNVGYWNLHDRSLRWRGFDGEAGWTVNGRPLSSFHFSGYSPDQPFELSRHEARNAVHLLPSVERLLADYRAQLSKHGWPPPPEDRYQFDRFPSGIPIDQRMRDAYKELELALDHSIDPWTASGEEYYAQALFSSHPRTGTLMPALLQRIYRDRPDLQHGYPRCDLDPQPLIAWFQHHGLNELPPHYRDLYDRYRPVVPDADVALQLGRSLKEAAPDFTEGAPLMSGRSRWIAKLNDSRHRQLREDLERYKGEWQVTSSIRLLWQIYESRPDLRHLFPDVLGADASRFSEWLAEFGPDELIVTPAVQAAFARCAQGRSLARIFSFVNRTHWLMARWPLAFIGRDREDFARVLLNIVRDDLEFDAEDIVMYLWTMHVDPYAGLPLALELLHNLSATPSCRLPEGQDALLGGLVHADPRCRTALEAYRERYAGAEHLEELHRIRSLSVRAIGVSEHLSAMAGRRTGAAGAQRSTPDAGANIFGYFKSPIGLGEMSRGTAAAMRAAGLAVRENVVGNVAMDADLTPGDFVQRFDASLPANIFVSYPHLDTVLLHGYPRWMTHGRRNIVYLAWEQRDSAPHWQQVFSEFDQVWALSTFAARSLERQLGRPVHAVNCVLEADQLPKPLPKTHFGLRDRAFTFLYVLDANSSLVRKNPEAVIDAFELAFTDDEDVELCLKIANAHRLEHRAQVQQILSRCARNRRIRTVTTRTGRTAALQLIGSADCYVSLHRAEGFGYTCAEAMAYGRPVIATNYSGNLDFMTPENSWLVRSREVEVERPEGPFQRGSVWADVDVADAAACMRDVYARTPDVARRAARARTDIVRLLSPSAVGASIQALLTGTPDAKLV